MTEPNVLLIHCHDLGTYLGCYGYDVETPRIDALAAEGARFDRHFVTAPQCSPSRGSLMTGEHPHVHGLLGLAHERWELDPEQRTLPEYLSAAGYETAMFGLQHVTTDPGRLGYDHIHPEDNLTPSTPTKVHLQARARDVAANVERVLENGEFEEPFFASVGFFECHRVEENGRFGFEGDHYDAPHPETVDPLPFLPDEPGIRRDIAELQGMVRAIDDGVGTILDALEANGLAEETLVVFTTEHGLAFPRAKGCCFDPGIEAALCLRYPGVVEPGVRDELVSNVDVFATLLEFAGVSPPDDVAGRSFASLLRDGEDSSYEPRTRVFAEMTWHDRYNPMRAIRTDRFKYIRNFWRLPQVHLTGDVFASESGRALREEYYAESRPYEELYDLEADPMEHENVASDPDYADVRERLREDLVGWMRETDDPLLDGPVVPDDWEEIHPLLGEEAERITADGGEGARDEEAGDDR